MAGQPGFFDLDERFAALSAAGDPLERLAAVIDCELFRAELDDALARSDRAKGGRPPYDAVLMFKVLILQTLYTLSDEQTEYLLHALSRSRSGGPGAGCQDHLAVPRAADQNGRDRAGVRALRCGAARRRLPRDGRPDRQCDRDRGAKAAAN